MKINTDITVYHVTTYPEQGEVYTPEWDKITTTEQVASVIDHASGNDRFRVVAFNAHEGWSRDVTEDIANEFQYDFDGQTVAYADAPEEQRINPNNEHRLCHFTQGTGRYGARA